MLLHLVLALHLISYIPGRSWCYSQESPDDLLYLTIQRLAENFEDDLKATNLVLQEINSLVEEYMGNSNVLATNYVKKLWEEFEEVLEDLNEWVDMYLHLLQVFHTRYLNYVDYKLGREILFCNKCWHLGIRKAKMCLEHPNVTMSKRVIEPSLLLYSNVKSLLQVFIETHLQYLEDHVKTLEQLLDNYTAATSKWLEKHTTYKEATSQDFARKLLSLSPRAEMLGTAQVKALQRKCFAIIKWLENHIVALEEWLWSQ
ncbi:uncharacterized protein LOC121919868 [Sceloporus undulatus]|uniref:uncharacterized protein LOC121919868 n=1 Tax=Sceloporus undulatus TaxID=8520 RepID=UPI001C4BE8DA|nr:uncharacterized protein LOC121919868 [Sceloporus undulatus]